MHNEIPKNFSQGTNYKLFDYNELLNTGYNKRFLNQSLHTMLSLPFLLFLMTGLASIFAMNALKKSDNLNDVSILADILVMKAIDKDGNKLFVLEDKLALMHKVDSDVMSRIATAMVQSPSPDQVKKN